MNWLKWIVDKLSRKAKPELTIDDYDVPVIFEPKHKFMDGNAKQKLTTKAWKHADKE